MKAFESIEKEFQTYNPLVFDLDHIEKSNILESNNDVQFSNNICFPEIRLGFHHFIHQAKDKMEVVEEFSNRKKVYLVTSLFEKNIDYKEQTDDGVKFTSIDDGVKKLIKSIKPDFPPLLNRAFLKMWELLVYFDLIPPVENFVSSHLAEGPGSFIQATILYRELQEKMSKIKSCSGDDYYGVTLHSDHDHLLMHQDFIKYFSKEKKKRLHIMETKSINQLKDMYGGNIKSKKIYDSNITNGDLTKLNTIKQFAGAKDVEGFAKPSDLVTSDGGFDWKKENLQEQEAYRLIFGEIISGLKIQKDGGNFVIKIFESYTKITIKLIQMLRQLYKTVYIVKPYTSRISNSEKYIVCKGFEKSKLAPKIMLKLEEQINVMNRNENYQILDMFTNIELSQNIYTAFKQINSELLLKQYMGINNIVKFINLDNYNGTEFNEFLDKQIIASKFWNEFFLNPEVYSDARKFFKKFNFIEFKQELTKNTDLNSNLNSNLKLEPENKNQIMNENNPTNKIESKSKISRTTSVKNRNSTTKSAKVAKSNKKDQKHNQTGGKINSNIDDSDDDILLEHMQNTSASIDSSDDIVGKLDSDDDVVDLNKF